MKKLMRGFAALSLPALLVTSCAQETIETKTSDGNHLSYGIATGKQTAGTRATEVDISDLEAAAGFKVEAVNFNGTGTFANRTYTLTKTGASSTAMGLWVYNGGTPVLHPNGTLDHYSTYPSALASQTNYTAGNLTFDYEVPASHSAQEDLIAASYQTTNATAVTATANLTFKHLLSQINFAVVGLDGYRITITDIKLNNIRSKGTFTFDTASTTPGATYPGTWSNQTTSASYSYVINGTNTVTSNGPAVIFGDGVKGGGRNNALMLLPQSVSGRNFTFDYTMEYDAGGGSYLPFDSGSVTVNLNSLGSSAPTEWVAGKRYLYTIYFETPIIIRYEVDVVSPWDTATDTPADVDNNRNGEESPADSHPGNEHTVTP